MGQSFKMNKILFVFSIISGAALVLFILPLLNLFTQFLPITNSLHEDWAVLLRITFFTCEQALLSSFVAGVFGCALAFICFETRVVGVKVIAILSHVTFFLPALIVALAIVGVWGNHGWVGKFFPESGVYGWLGILLGHLFFNFSVYFRLVGQSLLESEKSEEKVALSLGANRWTVFWSVTFQKIKKSVIQSFFLVFIYCLSSFVIILILGGGPRFTSLEVAIYQAIKVDFNLKLAALLASIQLLFCFVAHLFSGTASEVRIGFRPRLQELIYQCRTGVGEKLVFAVTWFFFCLVVLLPMIYLFVKGGTSISKLSPNDILGTLKFSILLGLKVAIVSSFLAFSSAYLARHFRSEKVKRWVSFLSILPVAVSNMVFGAALLTWAPSFRDLGSEGLWGVVVIQALSALPLSFRIFSESFSKIENEIYFSAKSLGASHSQLLTQVELPMLKKSIASSIVTGLGISLGEVGALLLFESSGNATFSIWLFRLMGKYQFGEANAVGVLLLFTMVCIFLVKESWEH